MRKRNILGIFIKGFILGSEMEALSDAQLAAEVAGISGIELCKFFDDFQNVSENYLNNRDFDNPSRAISNSTKSILSYDSPA